MRLFIASLVSAAIAYTIVFFALREGGGSPSGYGVGWLGVILAVFMYEKYLQWKKCPECGKKIKYAARRCRHCGERFKKR